MTPVFATHPLNGICMSESKFPFGKLLIRKWPETTEADLKRLLRGIKKQDKATWDEIFERYHPLMVKAVNDTLKGKGRDDLCGNEAVFQEIMSVVVRRIIRDGKFEQITHHLAIPAWLKKECSFRTLEWIKSQKKKSAVSKRNRDRVTVPIDTSLGHEESTLTVEDKVSFSEYMENKFDQHDYSEAERQVLDEINKFSPKDRLLMKAYLMFYRQLDEEDVHAIAVMRKVRASRVRNEIQSILDRLAAKNSKLIEEEERQNRQWHELMLLEAKLRDGQSNPSGQEIQTLRVKAEEKKKKLESMRNRKKKAHNSVGERVGKFVRTC